MKNVLIKTVLIAVSVFGANIANTQVVYDFDVCGESIFAATSKGIFTSTDNGTKWTECTNGIKPGGQYYRMQANGSTIFAVDYEQGIFISTDGGITWGATQKSPLSSGSVSDIVINGQRVFMCSRGKGIFATDDNGATWKEMNTGLSNKKISRIVLKGNTLFAASTKGVFKSVDNGESWTPANEGLKKEIDVLFVKGENLYAGQFAINSGVYVSKDDGASWSKANEGIENVMHFTASYVKGETMFVARTVALSSKGGYFYSEDNGATWKNGGLETMVIQSFLAKGDYLFAGTENGMVRSADGGNSWEPINEGFRKPDYSNCIEKPYTEIGTQNGVTLAAKEFKDQVVLKITNTTSATVNVSFKITVSCKDSNPTGGVSYTKNTMTRRISVPANSSKTFEKEGDSMIAGSCSKEIEGYVFDEWSAN